MKIKSLFIKIGSLFKRKHNIFFDAQNVIELTSNTLDIERYFRRVAHYSLNKIVEFGVRGAKNILKKNTNIVFIILTICDPLKTKECIFITTIPRLKLCVETVKKQKKETS
jgi:hypothetical protein